MTKKMTKKELAALIDRSRRMNMQIRVAAIHKFKSMGFYPRNLIDSTLDIIKEDYKL